MKPLKILSLAFGMFFIWVLWLAPADARSPAGIDETTGEADLTLLEGMVSLLGKDGKPLRTLAAGERLKPGVRIRTGNRARLSLRFQDGSHIRFSEFTTFALISLTVAEAPEATRNIRIRLDSGNAWLNAGTHYRGKGSLRIIAPKAVVKTTQSICRLTVLADNTSLLKVYQGHLEIRDLQSETADTPSNNTRPKRNKDSWSHLVNPMYQIYVRPDGTATHPFRFMAKADENDWVLWNQAQDAKLGLRAR